MLNRPQFSLILIIAVLGARGAETGRLGPRTAFGVPLAKLSVVFDELDESLVKVRIVYPGTDDVWEVARGNDAYIKKSRYGKETFMHTESPPTSHLITRFEAEQLERVGSTFIKTLKILERDLQKQRWDRLLYLDAFLPRFLRGFYHLYCAANNSSGALPRKARVPESAYEVSLNSPVSDKRIGLWREYPEQTLRLRLISRELAFQIRQWQRKELQALKSKPGGREGRKLEEAFALFVRVYFNRLPAPVLPPQGEHL